MPDFPVKGKNLFVESGNYNEFSHIAWGNIESQFYGYITGYKESADLIIQNALTSGDNHTLDTCVFPACFLYRQYIELAMKDLYLLFSGDNFDDKVQMIKKSSHNLKAIWQKVRPVIVKYFPNDDKTILDAVEDYIYQFAVEDSNSFAFRYPITKDLDPINGTERRINIKNLMERMNELESFLSAVNMGIGEIRDFENEMTTYYSMDVEGYY